jgi:hypothetical protein
MAKPDLSDYKEVAERIQDFRVKHPEGCLQSEILDSPRDGFVVVKAYAYRTPDDPRPGTGLAWEPVPGKTPYTKDSELMNAETSAWGRAIIAVGASDAKQIASADEVRNRREPEYAKPPTYAEPEYLAEAEYVALVAMAKDSGWERDYVAAEFKRRGYGKDSKRVLIPRVDKAQLEKLFGARGDIQSDDVAVGYRAGDAADEVPF